MKILVLCTGNSCRSQMGEAILQSLDSSFSVVSAGTNPSGQVHPLAIKVMAEKGIDLSKHRPKHVNEFLSQSFDYVITVCGGAKDSCPMFTGSVKNRVHIGFDDPAEATGTDEKILAIFRRVRDEIFRDFTAFYQQNMAK